jgi:hypothetical protein
MPDNVRRTITGRERLHCVPDLRRNLGNGKLWPAIYPVSADVRNAVWEYIDSHPDLNMIWR